MFIDTIRSEGLAHLSYIMGNGGGAAVIDPRRDCEIYIDIARRHGMKIRAIFETHRNEDYVIGSLDLARRTGAEIYHGNKFPFSYGKSVSEGDEFVFGNMNLKIIETPGHTYESISITLTDLSFNHEPIGVFTGDALFIGDVGRTDFFPEKAREVASLLYDSLFNKLLSLGDHVIIYPAHGSGSVCGNNMASREFSTIGYERKYNPVLQKKEPEEFINYKVNEHHYLPPYFKKMEEYNGEGAPALRSVPKPVPMGADEFEERIKEGMQILDIRSPEAYAGASVPGSISMPLDMIPGYAGWFLDYEKPIGLVMENLHEVDEAVKRLVRMGYDNIPCFLDDSLHTWEMNAKDYDDIPAIQVEEIMDRLNRGDNFLLLDVRKKTEFDNGHIPGSKNIYLGHLIDYLEELPKDRPITAFCGSGRRSTIAASLLKKFGFDNVETCLGSMAACRKAGCKLVA